MLDKEGIFKDLILLVLLLFADIQKGTIYRDLLNQGFMDGKICILQIYLFSIRVFANN